MSNLIDKHPAHSPHFLVIRGELRDIEEVGLADRVIVERLSISDKRLWAYRKITVPQQENVKEIQLLLEEYCIPIICIDCPDYLKRCLADAQATEGGQQST